MDKIKVLIYGNENTDNMKKGCANKKTGCNSKHGCTSCGSNTGSNLQESMNRLKEFIEQSDVKPFVDVEYIELCNNTYSSYSEVDELIERGFDTPITIIDGVVRYYGGISNTLIYNDIKELLQ